jgi:hypothetical protein
MRGLRGGVIKEIAEEPGKFPYGFGGAIHPPAYDPTRQVARFKDRQAEDVEGLRWMPAVLGRINANEEHAIRHTVAGNLGRATQSFDTTFHAVPPFSARAG